jgi:transcriptional regulator with XRE-family HTH domain
MTQKPINRLKVVLVEQNKTSKWLAEVLDKNPATVSRWCTNESQPSLENLVRIAQVLEIDIKELLVSTI